MAKYLFFKSVKPRTAVHMQALEGQSHSTLGTIDPTKNVSSDHTVRDSVPVGSIFYTEENNVSLSSRGYYSTSKIKIYVKGAVSKDVETEYNDLMMKRACSPTSSTTTSGTTTPVTTFLTEMLKDPKMSAPQSTKDGFYMSQGDWNLLVRNIKKSINTMIIGPTGCGKTSCVKEACDRLGKKLYVFDMGSMIDPVSSLLGVHRLEGGKSVFDFAEFTKAIQEPCVILLDELSRAPLTTNNVLFPCLDDRRKLSIEVASSGDTREIKVHPECCFIATANIGSEYTGTNTIDRALMNRFLPLELNYIPGDEEIKVLAKRKGIPTETAKLIVKIANNIRNLATRQEISNSLSIRETLMVADLVSDGWTLGNAMEMIYLPLYEGTKSEGERSTVYKTISSY